MWLEVRSYPEREAAVSQWLGRGHHLNCVISVKTGLEITAGQRTISGLIVDLTGQTFVLPVMLTGQNSVVLKMK